MSILVFWFILLVVELVQFPVELSLVIDVLELLSLRVSISISTSNANIRSFFVNLRVRIRLRFVFRLEFPSLLQQKLTKKMWKETAGNTTGRRKTTRKKKPFHNIVYKFFFVRK